MTTAKSKGNKKAKQNNTDGEGDVRMDNANDTNDGSITNFFPPNNNDTTNTNGNTNQTNKPKPSTTIILLVRTMKISP